MNFGGLQAESTLWEEARFVVLPVPYDLTSTYQSGSRRGPFAIIEASTHMELYDEELNQETYLAGIHTLPPLEPQAGSPAAMMEQVEKEVRAILAADKIPVILGGEHSITYGAVKAVKERFPAVGVLQFDAHADLRDGYQGSPFSHAAVARRIMEFGPLLQMGVRSLSREEAEFLREGKVLSLAPGNLPRNQAELDKVLDYLPREIYVTIDLDVLDPAQMPATGTPEPGGLFWTELLVILKRVTQQKRVVAFDVVELAPIPGIVAPDFLAAKLVYRIMGYLAAQP
jgi:agmatinase